MICGRIFGAQHTKIAQAEILFCSSPPAHKERKMIKIDRQGASIFLICLGHGL